MAKTWYEEAIAIIERNKEKIIKHIKDREKEGVSRYLIMFFDITKEEIVEVRLDKGYSEEVLDKVQKNQVIEVFSFVNRNRYKDKVELDIKFFADD